LAENSLPAARPRLVGQDGERRQFVLGLQPLVPDLNDVDAARVAGAHEGSQVVGAGAGVGAQVEPGVSQQRSAGLVGR
jgi:hypothetical protein